MTTIPREVDERVAADEHEELLTFGRAKGLLPDSGKIDVLVATAQGLLDSYKAAGKIHGDVTITNPALAAPIFINIDIPLPPMPASALPTSASLSLKTEGEVCAYMYQAASPQFVQAFNEAYRDTKSGTFSAPQHRMLQNAYDGASAHPLMWRRLQHHVCNAYATATGVTAIDWSAVKTWLASNWPQVISAICSIIMVLIAL